MKYKIKNPIYKLTPINEIEVGEFFVDSVDSCDNIYLVVNIDTNVEVSTKINSSEKHIFTINLTKNVFSWFADVSSKTKVTKLTQVNEIEFEKDTL